MKSNPSKTKRESSRRPPVRTHHTQRARHLTALKHGLNSGTVLLPGDNVQAFRTLRHREFRLFRPRNIEEARCVETIVAAHWRIERCRVEQQIFKCHLAAVLSGHPDVTGTLIDADPHRLHHRATDCGREERRLEKSMREAKTELALLQKHRAQNVIVGNESELEDYTLFMAEGEPLMAEAGSTVAEAASSRATGEPAEAKITADSAESTGSMDGRISKSPQPRDALPPPAASGLPVHWSRHQREAWHRQETERQQGSGL